MKMKNLFLKTLVIGTGLTAATAAFADPEIGKYPEIYPFVPFDSNYIYERVERISEDPQFEKNLFKMVDAGLQQGKTKNQPWMSTYWPLNKGLIADPYEPGIQFHRPGYELSWSRNYKLLTKRTYKVHPYIMELNQDELDTLAPSEKYDILLGDESFDLTNRLRKYMQAWGSKKEHGFLTMLDKVGGRALEQAQNMVNDGIYDSIEEALPVAIENRGGIAENLALQMVESGTAITFQEALPTAIERAVNEQGNYVLKKKNSLMALWEGICHGWSTAAGIVPRPLHTVAFDLPNGKKLKFYPDDIKGLASLLWANSLIQDAKFEYKDQKSGEHKISGGVIMQGLRCNDKSPEKDEWGRYYDATPDYYSKKLEPRCVGVHPAIWHLGLVNILGKQGRSFIVERKVKAAVDNHPMSSYSMEFFNPKTGDYGPMRSVITRIDREDQFFKFRSPKAKYIVGVKTKMVYLNWARPQREEYDSPAMDDLKDIEMLYDLELDANGNIVGGQWRSTEVGKNFLNIGADRTQPDFFWVITRHWKKTGYFNEVKLSPWKDKTTLPPQDWKFAALNAHSFMYQQTHAMGWNEKCEVINEDTDEVVEVPCEFQVNRPQPLINVVNDLVELSRE